MSTDTPGISGAAHAFSVGLNFGVPESAEFSQALLESNDR